VVCVLALPSTVNRKELGMSLRWKRTNHWKNIRMLVLDDGITVAAYIQRGRRPNEYTIIFPTHAYTYGIRHAHQNRNRNDQQRRVPDYTLTDSCLATAKAVGKLIANALE
jgi:biotin operon repressor